MAGRTTKWLIGCGAGGGLLVVIVIAVGLFLMKDTILGAKRTVDNIKEIAALHDEMVLSYGEVDDFVPPADGIPSPDRIDRFLDLRERLAAPRERLREHLFRFPPENVLRGGGKPLARVASVFRELGSLLPDIVSYLVGRAGLMRELEMSPGEYLYIYSLVYYSWLDHSPEDGPTAMEIDADGQRYSTGERILDGESGTFSSGEIWKRYHTYVTAQVRNQLAAALQAEGAEEWREQLRGEYLLMKDDPRRILWEDGLPASVAAALEPYRGRLEAGYFPELNCFELSPMKSADWEEQQRKWKFERNWDSGE